MGCEQCKGFGGVSSESVYADRSYEHEGNAKYSEVVLFLSRVELFKRLPEEDLPALADVCDEVEFSTGQIVINQGEAGNEFFVIKSGEAGVMIEDSQVASLGAGDYFGEMALLRDEPRSATITATSSLWAFKVTREKFQDLGLQDKLVFPKRAAVGGGALGAGKTAPAGSKTKTEQERQLVARAIKDNANISSMVELTDAGINKLVDEAWKQKIRAGQEVITEGDLNADFFYVVAEGQFQVKTPEEEGQSADKAISTATSGTLIGPGGSFGELALLYFAPRAATVKAKVESVVWVIDRDSFKFIFQQSGEQKAAGYVKYIERVELFKSALTPQEKVTLAKSLVEMTFSKDETVIEQGEKGDTFYILYQGNVAVIKDGSEVAKLTASDNEAQVFGERAMLGSHVREATVKVTSATCKALALDRESFIMMLGSLEDLKNRSSGAKGTTPKPAMTSKASQSAKNRANTPKIHFKELVKLRLLGCGGFGVVELVEHTATKEVYALKSMSKGYIVKSSMQQSVKSEKTVQMMCDSVFVVKLYETFTSAQTLYLLLELCQGGELYAIYNRKGFYGFEKHAKYYVSGTLFSFQHLHERKIVFRDLKPENLLLTAKGHVKLTDMGLAKVVVGKTFTTCGTPAYFAPELIESQGHNHAVDWWTLGILTFELMAGHPPFDSHTPMGIYQKVKKGINKVPFPPKIRGSCEDLIKNLCKKEPSERPPMKKGGIDNVKSHKWFKEYDWIAREDLTLAVPYKPVVKNPKDGSNFNARKEDMPPQIHYKDDGSGWDKDFATST